MIPFRRIEPIPADVVKRIRAAFLDGVAFETMRERFPYPWKRLKEAVADLPQRTRPKRAAKRTNTRIPMDLT